MSRLKSGPGAGSGRPAQARSWLLQRVWAEHAAGLRPIWLACRKPPMSPRRRLGLRRYLYGDPRPRSMAPSTRPHAADPRID